MKEIISNDKIQGFDEKGNLVYEVFFQIDGNTINITHTFVADSLRGQGVAKTLIEKVLAIAKSKNLKVKATCSYARAYLEKHPQSN